MRVLTSFDAQGAAKGELYMDDGHTFDYQKGKFQRRAFTFQNNELTSAAVTSDFYDTKSTVERVVVLGLNKAPSKVVLKSKSGTSQLEFDLSDGVLEIRKPNVPVNSDWSIVLQ